MSNKLAKIWFSEVQKSDTFQTQFQLWLLAKQTREGNDFLPNKVSGKLLIITAYCCTVYCKPSTLSLMVLSWDVEV